MSREIKGTGRLTIFPLLHDWQTGSRCVLAYTSMDAGYTAVMGVIPVEGNVFEPGDLFGLAGKHGFIGEWRGSHDQRCGCWLVATGHGALTVPKPDSLQIPSASWTLDMARTVELDSAYCGHVRVTAGRMSLEDKELEAQARALIPAPIESGIS
jgi:hypothetical protein